MSVWASIPLRVILIIATCVWLSKAVPIITLEIPIWFRFSFDTIRSGGGENMLALRTTLQLLSWIAAALFLFGLSMIALRVAFMDLSKVRWSGPER